MTITATAGHRATSHVLKSPLAEACVAAQPM
jgi:hypothetical protein